MELTRTTFARFILVALCAFAIAFVMAGTQALADSAHADKTGSAASSAADSETFEFTDSAGRTVEIPKNVTKVAPSGPLAQMVLFTFDPTVLCGVASTPSDTYQKYFNVNVSDYPEFGQVYGKKASFNKEAAAAAGTQLIIDIGEVKDTIKDDMDQLQADTGIPCIFIEAGIDMYDQTYTDLGTVLGNTERGKELADYCKKAYDDTQASLAKITEDQRVTIAYLTDESHAIALGSYQGQVVDNTANNVVVLDDVVGNGQGNEISLEQLAEWDPQVIVTSDADLYNAMADDAVWSTLSAVVNGTYYLVPKAPFNWLSGPPSINQVLGMQWLPRVCYPESFDNDMRDVVAEYFKVLCGYTLTDEDWAALEETSVPTVETQAAA